MNNSVEYKSTDHSGIQSSKSKQKNQKYLASINSGSKTSTTNDALVHNFISAPQQNHQSNSSQNAYQTLTALTQHS